jgi:acetoin utilization deacetylase AcuC-like enzyme
MKAGIIHDPCFIDHQTGHHPERPERLEAIQRALEAEGLFLDHARLPFVEATREQVCRIHHPGMVDRVFGLAEEGGGFVDPDTVVSPGSAKVAMCAAGAGISAGQSILKDGFHHVMCLVRPPGHHATPARSMGFCLFNNIAIAAEALLDSPEVNRVAIVDFDVHHGNGTQDVFYDRGDVFFLSIHQSHHYPGTGSAHERGRGDGLGKTLNFPLPGGVSRETWFDCFNRGLERVAKFEPDILLVSAGFDGHRLDPLGDFPLDEEAYYQVAAGLCALAGPRGVVSFLEGGYNLEVLGKSVASYLHGFR